MTQTKITKSIAIVLAMVIAFALMSVTLTNSAKAATKFDGTGYSFEISEPVVGKSTDKNNWYIASSSSYAPNEVPNFKVTIKYANKDGKSVDAALEDLVSYYLDYKDNEFGSETKIPADAFIVDSKTAEELTFTIDNSKVSGLNAKGVNYLVFKADATANGEENKGDEVVIVFNLPGTKTSSSSSSTTYRSTTRTTTKRTSYTYRTVSTRTVSTTNKKANPANTDDPSHMPLWVSIAILAAGAGAMTYVWKKSE